MKLDIKLDGLEGLTRMLGMMPYNTERRLVDLAAKGAMRPMLETARSNVISNGSVRSGLLAASLAIRSRKMRDGTRSTRIGPNHRVLREFTSASGLGFKYRPSSIAHLVERGTKPHVIKARRAKALSLHGGGRARKVQHPGSPAAPFMEPAFDRHKHQAVQDFGKDLFLRVDRWIRRNRRV